MDIGSQKILEFILGKSVGTITEEDRKFLIARRSYVADKDFERLGIDIAAEVAKIEASAAPEAEDEKPVAKMNKAELLAEAEKRGVVVPEGATNDAIRELLA